MDCMDVSLHTIYNLFEFEVPIIIIIITAELRTVTGLGIRQQITDK